MSVIKKQLRHLPVSNIYVNDALRISKRKFSRDGFIGFDTETYFGTCKLISNSKGDHIYNPNFDQALEFLWKYASNNYYRAFWNIDFDISSILKLWDDIKIIDKLVHGYHVKYKDYTLYYIRPRMFQMVRGKKVIYFVDLFNMFHMSLNKASKEFLNKQKKKDVDASRLNTEVTYWRDYKKKIIKYCIKDSELTAELGDFLMKKVDSSGLERPKFFTSHASLSKQYFRFNCKIAPIKFVPINILDIAFQCYYGGRFEILKRGYFDKLYGYDINSAYPSVIKDLPSLQHGKWEKVKKISKKETLGFYKVALDIKERYISPFPIRHKHLVIFPNGIYVTWITWYEADLLRNSTDKIFYGYEYKPNDKEYYPFKKAIDVLYKKKTKYKGNNEVFYWLFKLTMNALYGCFIERHKDVEDQDLIKSGILFNSVYGAIITAKTRYKLLKDIKKSDHTNIVGFHTDSIISTKPLDVAISTKLGDWSLEKEDHGVVLMSGVYQIGKESKRRGFAKTKIDWLKALEEFKDRDFVKIPYTKVMKIAESLKRFHNIDQVNSFIETHRKLHINNDKKRDWKRRFLNCNDALHNNISSKPITLHYIRRDKLK